MLDNFIIQVSTYFHENSHQKVLNKYGIENSYNINFLNTIHDFYNPKVKYKIELGISNGDHGNPIPQTKNSSRIILDAVVKWNFAGNFELWAGQTKLPGNRERVISSQKLQFVDRSELNSKYNIDRDMGFQLRHHHNLGSMLIREIVSMSQGEGRNVTAGNYVRIQISDEGVGIHADHIDKIFDPYFTTKQDGSGLGMAVTHSIIAKHLGYISCQSTLGHGTTFTFYLPATNKVVVGSDPVVAGGKGHGKIMVMTMRR